MIRGRRFSPPHTHPLRAGRGGPPGLTVGAGVGPAEEFAAGSLFPAFRSLAEVPLFNIGVFGEEAFDRRRLHP